MSIKFQFKSEKFEIGAFNLIACFSNAAKVAKKGKKDKVLDSSILYKGSSKEAFEVFSSIKTNTQFKGEKNQTFTFNSNDGSSFRFLGLGDREKLTAEDLRRIFAKAFKDLKSENVLEVNIDLDSFNSNLKFSQSALLIYEVALMSDYSYDKYLSKKDTSKINLNFYFGNKKQKDAFEKNSIKVLNTAESINVCRDFVNEVPNVLNSVEYAKRVEADVKKNLKGVKLNILNKAQIKKENMNLFLSVNSGSGYEPRLVHLTYTPKKVSKNTKHYALVGKGIVFDTGGYSLKPGANMMNMKFDMAGSATVYGAFRAAVLNQSPYKLTCIMALTDNSVNSFATYPDSVVVGRNGKSVEILNTDAEGRLILADALDFACDQKPDYIIDAATLTGACLVALGSQVAAVLGNDQKLIDSILNASKNNDEYAWQLPIINEWKEDMKSKVADLRNIGTPMRAGTATAAAFLENFIKNDIAWAHLDIAGVADTQTHLPYCPNVGASGLMIRSLNDLLTK